ncbi:MAG: response regulator [Elusimicrobia bacterium]|nr:response regulator [Elusimicrobiota bacterium]
MTKKWILTVDDDPAFLSILEETLSHPELSITTASDAVQAFIQARDLQPILIISDIYMPGGYGTQTLKLLREDPRLPRVPILFITGASLELARSLLPKNDPSIGLMQKPPNLPELRERVWKLAGVK